MSDSALSEAPFLPASPPKAAIIDCGGALTPAAKSDLESQAASLSYQVKVVILPADFSPTQADAFGRALAQQWHVSGRKLLLLVDMKAHKVRSFSGQQLNSSGLTGSYMRSELLRNEFIPYMKQGDLKAAISHTLSAADAVVAQRTGSNSSATSGATGGTRTTYGADYGQPSNNGSGMFWGLLLVLGAVVVVSLLAFRSRAQSNKTLMEKFNKKADLLYDRANQIGMGSEYLDREKNADLAQRVATFFNQLSVLDKAKLEVETLQKQKSIWKAADGIVKCVRLAELLNAEAEALLADVNAATGGVQSFAPPESGEESVAKLAAERDMQTAPRLEDKRFYRPEWTTEPVYIPTPLSAGPAGGLLDLMLILNQFETNRRLDSMAYEMHHNQIGNQGFADSGDATWGSGQSDSGSFGDSGWTDFGGGGDSGGGDIGGGDFGGGGGPDW